MNKFVINIHNKTLTNTKIITQRPRNMTLQPVSLKKVGSAHHPVIKCMQISLQSEDTNPAANRHSFPVV